MSKRAIYHSHRHGWHLSWGKARRIYRIIDIVEREREALIGLGVDTRVANDTFNKTEIKEGTLGEKVS